MKLKWKSKNTGNEGVPKTENNQNHIQTCKIKARNTTKVPTKIDYFDFNREI